MNIVEFKSSKGSDVVLPLESIDYMILANVDPKVLNFHTKAQIFIEASSELDAQKLYDLVKDLMHKAT
jgi:hypothetical protein